VQISTSWDDKLKLPKNENIYKLFEEFFFLKIIIAILFLIKSLTVCASKYKLGPLLKITEK